MEHTPREFVLAYFSREQPIPGATEQERLQCDYLYAGLLDSLGLIDLVGEIEEKLDVELTQDDFEDARFKTVGGLVDILEQKMGSRA
jgi:acyl carrier protein